MYSYSAIWIKERVRHRSLRHRRPSFNPLPRRSPFVDDPAKIVKHMQAKQKQHSYISRFSDLDKGVQNRSLRHRRPCFNPLPPPRRSRFVADPARRATHSTVTERHYEQWSCLGERMGAEPFRHLRPPFNPLPPPRRSRFVDDPARRVGHL